VEPNSDLVRAKSLDGVVNDEPATVELDSGLTAHRINNVRSGDGTEQPALAA
jgi:hypothetical protein